MWSNPFIGLIVFPWRSTYKHLFKNFYLNLIYLKFYLNLFKINIKILNFIFY